MTPMHIPLTIGATYTVIDYYGMLGFEAIYRGVLEDENGHAEPSELLLFKRTGADPGYHPYAGAIPEVSADEKGLHVTLRATYYGKTPRSLKHVTRSECDKPKWVRP